MSNISNRGRSVPASPIRKLVPLADQAKARGVNVYHLNIGQPDIETSPEFWNAVHSYPHKVLSYGHSEGLSSYRHQLLRYYKELVGIDIELRDILVTTGGSEAIIFAMMAISDPGDNILVFEPFYTNYNGYAAMCNVELRAVRTFPENGYHLPERDAIESEIDERTKGILICTPNNPTGTVLTRDEMEMLADIAREHDIYLISDEVYREFIYEGRHTSVFDLPEMNEHAIMLDSISKRFSACGARLGTLITKNRDVRNAVLHLAQARLCPPTIEQYAAKSIIEAIDEHFFEPLQSEYRRRRDATYDELQKIDGAFVELPAGAFYMMVKLPVDDIENFAAWLLTHFEHRSETTMIAPGPGFYATNGLGRQEARIAYVLEEEKLRRAVEIIRYGLEAYNRG